jgi:pSer/pThr/pTyr-binding forkhead associated (FHA) protein
MFRSVSPAELAERIGAERREMPFVLYLDRDGRQRIVECGEGPSTLCIGRDRSADIALDWDDEVSRVHAVLERVGETWTLVDDGLSRNGSFVNGERVHGRRRLEDGDSIVVGRTLLMFLEPLQQQSRTTARTRLSAPPQLSPAQRRVLEALCQPFRDRPIAAPPSNREIADRLVLSVETVKSHLHTLFELFELEDMPQNRKAMHPIIREALADAHAADLHRNLRTETSRLPTRPRPTAWRRMRRSRRTGSSTPA